MIEKRINKILMIIPSRNRAKKAKELIKTWRETQTDYSDLLFMLDDDDKQLNDYPKDSDIKINIGPRIRLGPSTNKGIKLYPNYKYYGFMGDDSRFRTKNWDRLMVEKIESKGGWGIAYGNDLHQGIKLPTAFIISANITDIMGYIFPPKLIHLFVDAAQLALGKSIGRLFYMPEIIIEHMHPHVKKAVWDEIYLECNSEETKSHDREVYGQWIRDKLPSIVEKIKSKINGKIAVSGYFLWTHIGHIELFEKAKEFGKLIVILNNDKQQKLKYGEIIVPYEERLKIIQGMKNVDEVVESIDEDLTVKKTLEKLKPNFFANGGDRTQENIPEIEVCERLDIQMIFNLGEKRQSSSWLIDKLKKN